MEELKTDWNIYHSSQQIKTKFAPITRSFTRNLLSNLFTKYLPENTPVKMAELGGGSSCFFDEFYSLIKPESYYLMDYNQTGLDNIRQKEFGNEKNIHTIEVDLIKGPLPEINDLDLVYSVGLIEHFTEEETAELISSHFSMLKPGGICVITFPTPTKLYQVSRKLAELSKQWIFLDERPLKFDEVLKEATKHGELLEQTINWPIIFTQGVVVLRKSLE